jgi:hypothetical protein
MNNVHTFQEADGRWRWEYRDDKVDLKSNRTYADERGALLAAQTAYPEHFGASRPGGRDNAHGFIGKIAKLLTLVLVISVWRRRRSQLS